MLSESMQQMQLQLSFQMCSRCGTYEVSKA
jgi:hypothetical protein